MGVGGVDVDIVSCVFGGRGGVVGVRWVRGMCLVALLFVS